MRSFGGRGVDGRFFRDVSAEFKGRNVCMVGRYGIL